MRIKNLTSSAFVLTAGLLIAARACLAIKAQETTKIDCNSKLRIGNTYKVRQQAEFQQAGLSLTGEIQMAKTQQCAKETCFKANMKIDDYDTVANKIQGYWRGSTIHFVRYVGQQKTTEVWSGQCLANSVSGQWYFPNNPKNGHLFEIAY